MGNRGLDEIKPVWTYDVATLYNRKDDRIEDVKRICNAWFAELPQIYTEFYNRIFKTQEYQYSCKVKYCIEAKKSNLFEGEWDPHCTSWTYQTPQSLDITIDYQDNLSTDYKKVEENVVLIENGSFITEYIRKIEKTLYYDGIRIWL